MVHKYAIKIYASIWFVNYMIRWFNVIRLNRIFCNREIWFGIGQTESFYESYDSEKDSDRITNPNLANFNDKTESRIRITD